jgi:hypothetical protein
MRPGDLVARPVKSSESGIGLPHSKTLRMNERAIRRDSVLECGSPMPLWARFVRQWNAFGNTNPPPHVGGYPA